MTEGTWNCYLLAIHPENQGVGYGSAMTQHVELLLAAQGGRVLLAETSGLEEFETVREFYRKNGYTEEARIRDFYTTGDDKIVFWKSIIAQEEVNS